MSPRNAEKNKEQSLQTRQKILDASLETFTELGFHGARISDIASRAGMSHGILYHYFKSKQDIFRELVDYALDTSIAAVNAALEIEGSAWEKIRNLVDSLIRVAINAKSSHYFLIMIQAMTQGRAIAGLQPYIMEKSKSHYANLIPLIIRAQAEGKAVEGDPTQIADCFFALIQGLAVNHLQNQQGGQSVTPDIILNLFRRSYD
jgi:AcrR family transcriptional regulator